jgi:hypothetical protein
MKDYFMKIGKTEETGLNLRIKFAKDNLRIAKTKPLTVWEAHFIKDMESILDKGIISDAQYRKLKELADK